MNVNLSGQLNGLSLTRVSGSVQLNDKADSRAFKDVRPISSRNDSSGTSWAMGAIRANDLLQRHLPFRTVLSEVRRAMHRSRTTSFY